MFLRIAIVVFLFCSPLARAAVEPHEFASEEHRKRYKHLIEELRCPKCKNNNLAGTNSQIAVDLRREIQKMIDNGDSDEQIVNFMVSRYGDFVLYRPRVTGKTLYVWLFPVALLGLGLTIFAMIVIKRKKAIKATTNDGLSTEEQQQLKAILGDEFEQVSESNLTESESAPKDDPNDKN